jgi:hypothetical protein
LSELVNEKCGITPEMAVRLSKVFGGSAEGWLVQQAQYDLAQVSTSRIKLKRSGDRVIMTEKGNGPLSLSLVQGPAKIFRDHDDDAGRSAFVGP